MEHACAATVVEVNSSDLTAQTTSFEPVSRRKRILNIIAEIGTESQLARLRQLQLAVQGRWLEWTDAMHSDLSWRRLIHGLDDGELQFNLRAISNTLPTPDNLRRWGQNELDPACPLCGTTSNPSPHPELLQCSASSLLACLQKLGFSASWRKKVRRECSRVALRCSYLLYLRRSIETWNSFNELSPDPSAASENRDTS